MHPRHGPAGGQSTVHVTAGVMRNGGCCGGKFAGGGEQGVLAFTSLAAQGPHMVGVVAADTVDKVMSQ